MIFPVIDKWTYMYLSKTLLIIKQGIQRKLLGQMIEQFVKVHKAQVLSHVMHSNIDTKVEWTQSNKDTSCH